MSVHIIGLILKHYSLGSEWMFATYGVDVVTTDNGCIINTLYYVFLTFLEVERAYSVVEERCTI